MPQRLEAARSSIWREHRKLAFIKGSSNLSAVGAHRRQLAISPKSRATGDRINERTAMRDIWRLAFIPLLAAGLGSASPVANQQGASRPTDRASVPVRPTQSGTQIFRTFSAAVAVIEATDDPSSVLRFGSGVLLAQRQVLVTNAHVVTGPGHIRARFGSASYSSPDLEVLYVDTDADLAVLRLATVPQQSPVIQLRTGPLPDVGERVFAIGNPQGLERTFSEGVVSGVRSLKGIGVVLQHTAPISPGSSGGALFSANGELIGLTVAYLDGGSESEFRDTSSRRRRRG